MLRLLLTKGVAKIKGIFFASLAQNKFNDLNSKHFKFSITLVLIHLKMAFSIYVSV